MGAVAGALFYEELDWNARLAKRRTRRRHRYPIEERGRSMSPDELVERLEALGVHLARRTVTDWTRRGVIREPVRGSRGRAQGRFTEYQDPWAVGDAVAAWMVAKELGRGKLAHPFEWYVKRAAFWAGQAFLEVYDGEADPFAPEPEVEHELLSLDPMAQAWLSGFIRGLLGLHVRANIAVFQMWSRAPWGAMKVCDELWVVPAERYLHDKNTPDNGITLWSVVGPAPANAPWRGQWPPRYTWAAEDGTRVVQVPTLPAPQFGAGGEEAAWLGLTKDGEPAWTDPE